MELNRISPPGRVFRGLAQRLPGSLLVRLTNEAIVMRLEPDTPGNSANRPGSPFNEPGINSVNGGIGGQNYSEKSQYDVACFQASVRH